MSSTKSENQIFHFAFRISLPINLREDGAMIEIFQGFHELIIEGLRQYCDKFIFQLENPGNNNFHYQGYCHVRERTRPKTLAKELQGDAKAFDPDNPFFGIECQACSTAGKTALKKYCMKQESRVAGPWADKKVYMGTDLPSEDRLFPFQKQVKEMLLSPNDRHINWIYDEGGNSGKTKILKYMLFHHETPCLAYGNSADILNLVSKFQGAAGYSFNLTRTKPSTFSTQDLYAAMESIKDGMFINTKYETDMVLMDCPAMVVVANSLPDMTCLSKDRWKIWTIERPSLELKKYKRPPPTDLTESVFNKRQKLDV